MRVVFAGDLHGSRDLYRALFVYALKTDARCILMGGDILPTLLKSPWKLLVGKADFSLDLRAQISFIDTFLAPLFRDFIARHPDVSLLYVPGNHDWVRAVEHLEKAAPGARCIHCRTESVDGVAFTGYGCTKDSLFWVKDFARRDLRKSGFVRSRYPLVSTGDGVSYSLGDAYALERPSMEEELSSLAGSEGVGDICVFHSPPFGSGLDMLYSGASIGSKAVAGFIGEHDPKMSLHGHIHEAPYMSGFFYRAIGRTLAINPGYSSNRLHAVAFDTDNPGGSLMHSIFRTGPVSGAGLAGILERPARRVKGFLVKKALMR